MSEPRRARSPALRRGLVAAALGMSLLGFASGFALALQRRDLAEDWVLARARAAGLTAPSVFVGRLDWGTFELHDLRAGEGGLEVARLEASFGVRSLLAGGFEQVRVRGVELRGRRPEVARRAEALVSLLGLLAWEQLAVESARAVVETDAGEVEVLGSGQASRQTGRALQAEARLESTLGALRARLALSGSGTLPELSGEAALELLAAGPPGIEPGADASLRTQATFRTTRETIEIAASRCADLVVSGLRLAGLAALASPLRTCLGGATPPSLRLSTTEGQGRELAGSLEALPVSLDLELADGSRAQAETPHLGLALAGSPDALQVTLTSRGGFLRLEEAGFEARDLTGSLVFAEGGAEGRMRLAEIVDVSDRRGLPRLRVELDARRKRSGTEFEVLLEDDARLLTLEIVGRAPGAGAAARADLRLQPVSLDAEGIELLRVVPGLEDSRAGGTLAALGSFVWGNDGPRGHLELALRDVDLASRHAHVELASGVVRFEGPPLSAPPDQLLAAARLDVGLELLDGVARFALSPERGLALDGSRFSFAGGWAEAQGSLGGGEPLVVTVEGVDPSALFDRLDLPELVGEGSLAGTLSLAPVAGGFSVEAALFSEEAGWLRYRAGPEEPEEVRQALAPHAEALADFGYEDLEVGFSGRLPGAVDVVATLSGSNPGLASGAGELRFEVPGALESRPRTTVREGALPEEIEARLVAFEERMRRPRGSEPARAQAATPE